MDLLATPPVYPAMGSWSSVGIALIDVFTDPHSSATFPAQGSVQLIWTVFNGTCGQVSDTAVVSVQECVIGVPELADRQRTTCWFDASSKVLSVRNASARESVELIDQNGRVVQRSVLKAVNDNRIDLSGVRPGFYTAKVVTVGQAGVLRFVIDRAGRIKKASLEKPSGAAILDAEALAMLDRAQPLPPLPANVRAAEVELVVPVNYKLK